MSPNVGDTVAAVAPVTAVTACRACGSGDLVSVLDLGTQPAADHFPSATDPGPDPRHPLGLVLCRPCLLLQLSHTSPAAQEPRAVESATVLAHARTVARKVVDAAGLAPGARVREFFSAHGGSWQDGLAEAGMAVVARSAEATESGTMLQGAAESVVDQPGSYDLVIDNHDLIHAEDAAAAFVRRAELVAPGGVLAIEFHHALAQVTQGQYDTVRHGHPVYFSLHAWSALCEAYGFRVVHAWAEPIYGGCLVVLAQRVSETHTAASASVHDELERERAAGLTQPEGYAVLAERAATISGDLRAYLHQARDRGAHVVGYGAGSKAPLLLGAAGVDIPLLSMTADLAPAKHGRRLPGTQIAIGRPEDIVAAKPDEVVVLLWDLAPEVIGQLRAAGLEQARFVVPAPVLRVVEPGDPVPSR